MKTRRWGWVGGLLAVVALIGVVGGQLVYVHAKTGQWSASLSDARAPGRIHFQGRDYDRGGSMRLPSDAVKRGKTAGGGVIYLFEGAVGTPTGIIVTDGDQAWGYGLVGGP